MGKSKIDENYWKYIYETLVYEKKGKTSSADLKPNGVYFVNQSQWEQMIVIESKLQKLKGLISGFKLSTEEWLTWYTKPDITKLPGVWGKNGPDSLCKLLICKILRPDKFIEFAIEFIKENLGDEFIPEGMPDLGKIINPKNPIVNENNCIVFIKEKGTYPDQYVNYILSN